MNERMNELCVREWEFEKKREEAYLWMESLTCTAMEANLFLLVFQSGEKVIVLYKKKRKKRIGTCRSRL